MTKWRVGTALTVTLVLTVACDPGIRIIQVSLPGTANTTSVMVSVKTSYPLIGRTWYAPHTEVTNLSQQSITITSAELRTQRVEYANKPRRVGSYPLIVAPRETVALDIWFDLREEINKIFEEPAELRVHYRSGEKDAIANARMVGGNSQ